ncbi:MAG: hypothetical protein BM556_09905 [Bacteriovorax sp. MedPE-SWde]|nr:MAG: hypothetical protein BM556_09905 [Bacteriovorax sp. MedPE-SWde]
MKILILGLLLTTATNVLALSESKTDAAMDSQCLHKKFYADMDEIDSKLAAAEKKLEELEGATTTR